MADVYVVWEGTEFLGVKVGSLDNEDFLFIQIFSSRIIPVQWRILSPKCLTTFISYVILVVRDFLWIALFFTILEVSPPPKSF